MRCSFGGCCISPGWLCISPGWLRGISPGWCCISPTWLCSLSGWFSACSVCYSLFGLSCWGLASWRRSRTHREIVSFRGSNSLRGSASLRGSEPLRGSASLRGFCRGWNPCPQWWPCVSYWHHDFWSCRLYLGIYELTDGSSSVSPSRKWGGSSNTSRRGTIDLSQFYLRAPVAHTNQLHLPLLSPRNEIPSQQKCKTEISSNSRS